MGQSAAEKVREIEETRGRLGENLHRLEEKIPPRGQVGKSALKVLVGGGTGGTVFWFALRKARARRRKKAVAVVPVQAVINVVPDRWAEAVGRALEDDKAKTWALGIAGTWIVLRLVEIRQLRKLRRSLPDAAYG
jgi:hypothetical protein